MSSPPFGWALQGVDCVIIGLAKIAASEKASQPEVGYPQGGRSPYPEGRGGTHLEGFTPLIRQQVHVLSGIRKGACELSQHPEA